MNPRPLQIEVSDEKPAEMGCVGDAAAVGYRGVEGQCAHDHYEVLRRNGEDEVHGDWPIGEVEGVGEQKPVDRPRCANDDRVLELTSEEDRQDRKEDGEERSADAGHEIELHEVSSTPDPFQLGAEHPE